MVRKYFGTDGIRGRANSGAMTAETVLKEYRNIRNSFETNRTFVEASELFIYEMDLIRRTNTFDDGKIIEKINECIKHIKHKHIDYYGWCWYRQT